MSRKKKPTKQVKAIENDGVTTLDHVVTESFSEEVTVEQGQRDEGYDGKSQLCKSLREDRSRQREYQVRRP